VVKHAQIEVQKLEAQAQAQAVAAMQVSAAVQRAEAEAQKHLVVHAQVAAQAQQLQAKAVNLQVRAGLGWCWGDYLSCWCSCPACADVCQTFGVAPAAGPLWQCGPRHVSRNWICMACLLLE
jgi:hypothetical protein